jgi:hypothetical protein
MFATRHHVPLALELIKWLVLAAAAIGLVAALATALAAADPMTEPDRLPDDMGLLAKPMPDVTVQPYFPEGEPALAMPAEETAARLWMTLEEQRAGRIGAALAGWEGIRLPTETEVWRQVGMAAAHLTAGQLAAAQDHLTLARDLAPENAVVAYYTGLLRMEQAAAAVRVPDDMTGAELRLVAHVPARGTLAAIVFKAMARAELHRAVARAEELRLDDRLIVDNMEMEERIVVPRVGDLLVALEADNFVGKAHHLLFGLEMDRGLLAEAETHLDLAVATGIAPLYGYEELAEAFLAQGNEPAALRAGAKDMQANYPLLWKAGQEMNEAVGRMWEGWVW